MSAGFAPPEGAPTVETAMLIAAPIGRVWTILTDFARYGTWNRYITGVAGDAAVGSVIEVTSAEGTGTTTKSIAIEGFAPHVMHWVGGADSFAAFRGDHFFELQPVAANETLLLHREYFTGHFAKSIVGEFGELICENFDLFNQCLKEKAEKAVAET